MAKARSIIKLSGTVAGVTYVDSVAYGLHVRAQRGTYTPISLAEGMKESSSNQTQANLMAKVIFDAINEFAPGFKDGKFWSRLLSVFRQQKKAGKVYSYKDFNDMEMRWDYSTAKHGRFSLSLNDSSIMLSYNLFKETGYRLSLLRMAADHTLLVPYPAAIMEIEVKEGETLGMAEFDFTPLPTGTNVLYALQCEQLKNGQATGVLKGKSVRLFTRD